MSKKDKLLKELLTKPNDFTFEKLSTLLSSFGYALDNKGKTSGSRVTFIRDNGHMISLHKPHPGNELKKYVIDIIIKSLKENGDISE